MAKIGNRAVAVLLCLSMTMIANAFETEYGTGNFVQYQIGEVGTKVVLVSAHGGQRRPSSIPARHQGCYRPDIAECEYVHSHCASGSRSTCTAIGLNADLYTREITLSLAEGLKRLTGHRPHVILSNLHRSKLDANRPLDQATFWNDEAVLAWHEFHAFVKKARLAIDGPGLVFDIHGQIHRENWVELGYRISKRELNARDFSRYLDSSVRALKRRHPHVAFRNLIYGRTSLGSFLQQEGYKTVPSPRYPRPNSGGYFRGGYSTLVHGSRYGGNIDAIQIESPRTVRNSARGPRYVAALARAIKRFMDMYY